MVGVLNRFLGIFLAGLLVAQPAFAVYFPQTTVVQPTASSLLGNSYTFDGSGNSIGSTSGALNSFVTNSSLAVTGTFFQATQPVSGSLGRTWSLLNTTDSVNVGNFPATQAVTGTFFQATQPVSATALPLPTNAAQETGGNLATIATNTTGAATSALQTTGNTSLSTIANNTGNIPAKGAATTANSMPVNIASDQTVPVNLPDLIVTGQSAQTALVNNILTATSGATATNLSGYRSASVQVTSTGTGGTFIFEGSNDNTNFQTIPVYSQLVLTGTPITAAITATASQLVYTFPIQTQYVRLRIATAITGGSIQAFSRFSQATWTPAVFQVASNSGANLNANVSTVTTVNTVTSDNTAIPGIIADVASAALTTTTTTATLTPTFGSSYSVNIPVTVVTGTTPTLDVEIQESRDTGTNWVAVYDFPRITATGSYNSPVLPLQGNRIRYVQTVSGTTPSFTRAINRLQTSTSSGTFFRQIIDRTITLTSLGSTTAALNAEYQPKNVEIVINIGAASVAPALQIQSSDDAGATWVSIGTPLTAVASSTVSATINNMSAQMYRAIVTTPGTGVTAGYVLLRAF